MRRWRGREAIRLLKGVEESTGSPADEMPSMNASVPIGLMALS